MYLATATLSHYFFFCLYTSWCLHKQIITGVNIKGAIIYHLLICEVRRASTYSKYSKFQSFPDEIQDVILHCNSQNSIFCMQRRSQQPFQGLDDLGFLEALRFLCRRCWYSSGLLLR